MFPEYVPGSHLQAFVWPLSSAWSSHLLYVHFLLIFLSYHIFNETCSDYSFFFLAAPCSLWDLSFPSRDQTQAPAVKVQSPNHWTTREFPDYSILNCRPSIPPPLWITFTQFYFIKYYVITYVLGQWFILSPMRLSSAKIGPSSVLFTDVHMPRDQNSKLSTNI